MAFDPNPASWISGWSTSGTSQTAGTYVSFPIASVPQLTSSEAQATSSGDVRKCWFAVIDKMFQTYNALANADRPTKMLIFKSANVNTSTGVTTYSYTFQFETSATSEEVVAE